ncbi:MAG: CTP synthase, partial [Candidatus Babeliales bacterium]
MAAQLKLIVIVGGVMSGVGKGVAAASLGRTFKEYGFNVTFIKIDPYMNCDAGTMKPTEHGEVWVTEDGKEIDQDLGTYERFLGTDILGTHNITSGQIYKTVIEKERRGEYLGETVQFIPHIPDEIIRRIKIATAGYEVAIIEVGGTVGDYENKPFLFAINALERELGSDNVAYVLVTYLPVPGHIQEMKTKPAQQAIKMLNEEGIWADFIICRSEGVVDEVRKKKIELFANIPSDHIISAPDISSIYEMPLILEQEQMGAKLLKKLGLVSRQEPQWAPWKQLVHTIKHPSKNIKIGIVGKYFDTGDYSLTDSYISIYQSLIHAGASLDTGITISWINAKKLEDSNADLTFLDEFDGIIVPGGFGTSGVEGKIHAIEYVRTHGIPYIGLCYGFQLAVVEFARNVCGMHTAHTTEVDPHTPHPIIDVLPLQKALLEQSAYGGTMRLGAYKAILDDASRMYALYKQAGRLDAHNSVSERHRHRYEVNPIYVDVLQQHGLVFSGYHEREDGTRLMEFLELPDHPFFVATQAHPE